VKERGEVEAMTGDMTAIPSMTVERLLDKAKNCPNLSSVQLQEALESAGLVHYEIGKQGGQGRAVAIFLNLIEWSSR
jgi:hypothetical protein